MQIALEQVLFPGVQAPEREEKGPSAEMMQQLRGYTDRPIMREQVEAPKLTESQVKKALMVIPVDYWAINCCTCRGDGHSAFSCTYISIDQHLHFAYRYYLHQVEANPHMACWLEERDTSKKDGRPFGTEKPDSQRGPYSSRGRGGVRGGWVSRGRGGTAYQTYLQVVHAVLQDQKDTEEELEE